MTSPASGEADGRGSAAAVAVFNVPAQGEADGAAFVESLGQAGFVTVTWGTAYASVVAAVAPVGEVSVTITV